MTDKVHFMGAGRIKKQVAMEANKGAHPLKIGYFLGTFPSLTETFVMREIQVVRERGIEVEVFAIKRSGNLEIERSVRERGIDNNCCYARPDSFVKHFIVNVKKIILNPIRYFGTLRLFTGQMFRIEPMEFCKLLYHFYCGIGFSDQIGKKGITQIHCHFKSGANMALALHLFKGIPFTLAAHGTGDIFFKPVLLQEKIKHAAFVMPVSIYNRKYLDSYTDFKYSSKFKVIYNGIDKFEIEKLVGNSLESIRLRNIRPDVIKIASVGTLYNLKGHGTLIKACRLVKDRGHRIECEIIGDGPRREALEILINELKLDDSIRIRGYLPLRRVYKILANSDIFVLLSEIGVSGRRDGLPTVILEAMLMSLPVVSTAISGIPEMVIHGKTGFLTHERDAGAAADAIETLIKDEKCRLNFGMTGRQRVLEVFDLKRNMEKKIEAFLGIYGFGSRAFIRY